MFRHLIKEPKYEGVSYHFNVNRNDKYIKCCLRDCVRL